MSFSCAPSHRLAGGTLPTVERTSARIYVAAQPRPPLPRPKASLMHAPRSHATHAQLRAQALAPRPGAPSGTLFVVLGGSLPRFQHAAPGALQAFVLICTVSKIAIRALGLVRLEARGLWLACCCSCVRVSFPFVPAVFVFVLFVFGARSRFVCYSRWPPPPATSFSCCGVRCDCGRVDLCAHCGRGARGCRRPAALVAGGVSLYPLIITYHYSLSHPQTLAARARSAPVCRAPSFAGGHPPLAVALASSLLVLAFASPYYYYYPSPTATFSPSPFSLLYVRQAPGARSPDLALGARR
eukprot:scaffold10_cov116-Isochrysis_galbana.AAC.2